MIRLRKYKTTIKRDEQNLQIMVIQYLHIRYPTALFTISPQGMKLPMMVAVNLKRMGYRKGTPDIILIKKAGIYSGMMLELKTETGKMTKEQDEFFVQATQEGFYCRTAYGFQDAINKIEEYFNVK